MVGRERSSESGGEALAALSYAASGITRKHVFGPFAGSLCSFFLFVAAIRLEPFKMVTAAERTWTELSCRLQGLIYLAGLFSHHIVLQFKKPKSQIHIYCMYGATASIYRFGCRWRERASERVSE